MGLGMLQASAAPRHWKSLTSRTGGARELLAHHFFPGGLRKPDGGHRACRWPAAGGCWAPVGRGCCGPQNAGSDSEAGALMTQDFIFWRLFFKNFSSN